MHFNTLYRKKLLFAQLPPVCPSTEPPGDQCSRACVYCSLNGLTSTTAGYTGQPPSGYCGLAENEQWIGFVAGETSATFTAIPSNCTDDNGLQKSFPYPSSRVAMANRLR